MTRRTTDPKAGSGRKSKSGRAVKQGMIKQQLTAVGHLLQVARKQGFEGSHPSTKAVITRPQASASGRRVAEFARIARGQLA